MKMFSCTILILMLLACSARKSSHYQALSREALAVNEQMGLKDSSILLEVKNERGDEQTDLYQIAITSPQAFYWHPDSGLRLDGGKLVISRWQQHRQMEKLVDKQEQRLLKQERQVAMDWKKLEEKELSKEKRGNGRIWGVVGLVLVLLVLGCWWWVRR